MVDVKNPIPPSHLLMQISNNPNANDFVGSFNYTRAEVLNSLKAANVDFASFDDILDFGCGVGRFLFSMRSVLGAHQRLFGCDVDPECAAWCRDNIDFADVTHTKLDPPLPYPDERFDFIYALSVFTHLSFDFQLAWAMELHRVMRPGGVLFFTTHGELHLPLMIANAHAARDLAMLGEDGLLWTFAERQQREDEGQREVAVIHSRTAIDDVFSGFEPLYHRRISNFAGGQSLSIRRRPRGTAKTLPAAPAERRGMLEASRQSSDGVTFSIPAFTGVRPFRFLLAFDEMWHAGDAIACEVELIGRHGSRARSVVPLPFKSFGGSRHFVPLSVDLDGDGEPCEIAWTISWTGKWRPEGGAIRYTISHARLESYPGQI